MKVHSLELDPLSHLLLRFCHEPWSRGCTPSMVASYAVEHGLCRWLEVLPDFRTRIEGKRIVDLGCGWGYQAVGMAENGAALVLGVDIGEECRVRAVELAAASPASDRIRIAAAIPPDFGADLITSQNSFEHFLDAGQILAECRKALRPGGEMFITFAPPWYSPWGAHMAYFCSLPWVHLLFPERVIMRVRSLFRKDGCRSYKEAGLARMSLARFEHIVQKSGFRIAETRYDCSAGLSFLSRAPLIRELFVNRVTAVMKVADGSTS